MIIYTQGKNLYSFKMHFEKVCKLEILGLRWKFTSLMFCLLVIVLSTVTDKLITDQVFEFNPDVPYQIILQPTLDYNDFSTCKSVF